MGGPLGCGQHPGGLRQVYGLGVSAGLIAQQLDDGSVVYTIGKASEFVAGFDVPMILAALRAAELRCNPSQPAESTWGGGSTIGGSPRNPDGSASRLTFDEVIAVVAGCVDVDAKDPTFGQEK